MNAASHPLPSMNPWLWSQTLGETFAAKLDPQGIGRMQRDARLRRLITEAAAGSPFYRERIGRAVAPKLTDIEPVGKAELMRRFDDWATDRRITRASVDAFLADPARVADAYLGRYLVWTSSGTTGEPGIFVQDEASLAAFDAMDLLRFHGLGPTALPGAMWGPGQRYAFVAATGGHFAGVASIERLRRIGESMGPAMQWLRPAVQTFSVLDPLPELMAALQAFAPTVLITYPSCADLLAHARAEGRIELAPHEIWLGGEQLSAEQRTRIQAAFACRVRNNYGASEFYSIGWECGRGRMHLNDDWLIMEPVDGDGRPVPPGEASHSVLLTNLANRTQPLLRYRLGDSLRFAPGRCACGSGFPVIEVQGRADHTLVLRDPFRREVRLLPLAIETVIEEGAQLTQFQLVGTSPESLALHIDAGVPDAPAAFERARSVLGSFLRAQGLPNVRVVLGDSPPLQHARSGKRCRVLAV